MTAAQPHSLAARFAAECDRVDAVRATVNTVLSAGHRRSLEREEEAMRALLEEIRVAEKTMAEVNDELLRTLKNIDPTVSGGPRRPRWRVVSLPAPASKAEHQAAARMQSAWRGRRPRHSAGGAVHCPVSARRQLMLGIDPFATSRDAIDHR